MQPKTALIGRKAVEQQSIASEITIMKLLLSILLRPVSPYLRLDRGVQATRVLSTVACAEEI